MQTVGGEMAKILDGKSTAQKILEEVKDGVKTLQVKHGIVPGLAAILVGDNPASAIYVRNKERACREVGITTKTFRTPRDIQSKTLLTLINKLNNDNQFHGILLQLPLPVHLDTREMLNSIRPEKDIDGIHPLNLGRLATGNPLFVPCTPAGVHQLLLRNGYSPEGKHVVICGRSDIVGKPLATLLMQKQPGANATVTLCHTSTNNLSAFTRKADILIVAMGTPGAINANFVKKGAVVVDVGTNQIPDTSKHSGYRLAGDVDFDGVSLKAAAISPVPGGVGPMTIAMLLVNTLKASQIER